MTKKNKVTVRILGQEYVICSDESREFIQKVANLVDDKMQEIHKKNKKFSTTWIAVLTALNLGDDYIKLKREQTNTNPLSKEEAKSFEMIIETLKEKIEQSAYHQKTLTEKIKEQEKIETDLREKASGFENRFLEEEKEKNELLALLKQKEKEITAYKVEQIEYKKSIEQLEADFAQAEKDRRSAELELSEFIETFDTIVD